MGNNFTLTALNDEVGDDPLFDPSDPLTFELPNPDTGAFRRFECIDTPLLPDDRVNNLRSAPRAYLVETLAGQVAEGPDRRAVRDITHKLFDEQMVDVDKIMELIEFLNDQREEAKKRRAKRKLARPTGGPSPSLQSSN